MGIVDEVMVFVINIGMEKLGDHLLQFWIVDMPRGSNGVAE